MNDTAKQQGAWEPKIIAFLCNWCSYAGADLAGVSRYQYPPSIRIVRVPCSGRVSPNMILDALRSGADGVLVSGCHPGDCHYQKGNYYERRKIALTKTLLKSAGLNPERLRLSWISASEGPKFAETMNEFGEKIEKLGKNPFEENIFL